MNAATKRKLMQYVKIGKAASRELQRRADISWKDATTAFDTKMNKGGTE